MSDEKLVKIDASPEAKGLDRDLRTEAPKTVSDFEVLLSRYKKQSPENYEKKLANGTFVKQAKALGIAWKTEELLGATPVVAPVVPEPTAIETAIEKKLALREQPKVEEKVEKKEVKVDGRTSEKKLLEIAKEKGLTLDGTETKKKLIELLKLN